MYIGVKQKCALACIRRFCTPDEDCTMNSKIRSERIEPNPINQSSSSGSGKSTGIVLVRFAPIVSYDPPLSSSAAKTSWTTTPLYYTGIESPRRQKATATPPRSAWKSAGRAWMEQTPAGLKVTSRRRPAAGRLRGTRPSDLVRRGWARPGRGAVAIRPRAVPSRDAHPGSSSARRRWLSRPSYPLGADRSGGGGHRAPP